MVAAGQAAPYKRQKHSRVRKLTADPAKHARGWQRIKADAATAATPFFQASAVAASDGGASVAAASRCVAAFTTRENVKLLLCLPVLDSP